MVDRRTRRSFLAVAGSSLLGGCLGGGGDDATPTGTSPAVSSRAATSTSTRTPAGTTTPARTPTRTDAPTRTPTTGTGDTPTGTPTRTAAFVDGRITFLLAPTEPREQFRAPYVPFAERLEEHVDPPRGVELEYADDYGATLSALAAGTADVAETGPFAAALGVDAGQVEVLLQRFGHGTWTYASVILTRRALYESGEVNDLTDLSGRPVAFADPLSTSGSLYPLYMLKEAGLSVPQSPGVPTGAEFRPTWGSHGTAFRALREGAADAAGVGRFVAVEEFTDDGPVYPDDVVVLASEDGIPRAPIVGSPKLTVDERWSVVRAFTQAPDRTYYGADGREGTDDDPWFSNVRPADADTYRPVVEVARTLGYGTEVFDSNGKS